MIIISAVCLHLIVTVAPEVALLQGDVTIDTTVPRFSVLHRESLSDNRELLVTRGPLSATTPFKDFLPARFAAGATGCFWLELYSAEPESTPIRMWSKLVWLSQDVRYEDFIVFDLLTTDGLLILATGTRGTIRVTLIGIREPDRVFSLPPGEWGMTPALHPPPELTLTANLTRDARSGRVQVAVTQSSRGSRQHTIFEQHDDAWEFSRVKQWRDPTTPTTQRNR